MKRSIVMALVGALLLSGCGGDTVCGVHYNSYGLFNESTQRNPDIAYEVSIGSVVMGIIFLETIIIPIYVFGFDLYYPAGLAPTVKGTTPRKICGERL